MVKFEESMTKKNLEKALQGEALAHLKYQFYKSQISKYSKEYENILDGIIHNEKEHGKIWFKKLHEGNVPDNLTNLLDAVTGETYEYTTMYKEFSEIAEEEGFHELSQLFHQVGDIENHHSKIFQDIYNKIQKQDSTFKTLNDETEWECSNCGHIYTGRDAPEICPVCDHPMKYFKRVQKTSD